MTGGEATVSTCVCVTMEGSVIACLGRVCVLLATSVPHVKTGVLKEPSAVDVSTLVCVRTVLPVSMIQEHVCVHLATLAPTVSEVRENTMY